MFDAIVSGGTVVDGSGTPGYRADVGIRGDRFEAIGDLSEAQTRRMIVATGLVVSPGFIDTHTHSEGALLTDPQHAYGLRQGITTEIMGLDGVSYAPLSEGNYRLYRRYLAGLLGDPPEGLDMSSVSTFRSHYHRKMAINTAYLVPHGAVRLESLGFRDAPLVGDALQTARRLVREGIEQGAVGLSTGLNYYPGTWADTDELVQLCETVRDAGGVYVTELRRANTERGFQGGGVPEALETARRSGVKVHLAHHRTAPENAGRLDEVVGLIDEAEAEGIDCSLDVYPYPMGSSYMVSFLPSYAHEGGPDAVMRRLEDADERAKLADFLDNEQPKLRWRPLADVVFCYLPKNSHLEGMSLPDVARQRGATMGETVCDLLLEEELKVGYCGAPPHSTALWRQVSLDTLELLSRPDYMACSDITPLGSLPHPRCYGAFPRFLGRLRRASGILSIEQMVQRMTDNPARRFGLTGRGRIQKGYYADLVAFDPERIMDNATYDDPRRYPTGIPYVMVNGRVAVDRERCTGVLAGYAVP